MSKKYPKTPVMAIIYDEPKPRKVLLKRKVAQTLRALVDRGELGITALEMSNTWALRIADYVFSLRHNHKIGILMVREPHIFTRLSLRAHNNFGQYMKAAETYLRLALKAQSQCRATLETLAEIKNPRPYIQNNRAEYQQVNNGAG
jgi:mRNA-degrading endonuclease RelE of RelBE toxin-antitoxin system